MYEIAPISLKWLAFTYLATKQLTSKKVPRCIELHVPLFMIVSMVERWMFVIARGVCCDIG